MKPDAAVPKSSSSVTSAASRWWSVPMSTWQWEGMGGGAEEGRREEASQKGGGREPNCECSQFASLKAPSPPHHRTAPAHLDVEGLDDDEREGPGGEVGDEVPRESGEPVRRDGDAADELQVLGADLLLLDDLRWGGRQAGVSVCVLGPLLPLHGDSP